MADRLPPSNDGVTWYHRVAAAPLQMLAALNIGPLGGENSLSAVIESVLAPHYNFTIDFELSKSEQFFVDQMTREGKIPDPMLEYRDLCHTTENEILRRWGNDPMAVIWLGAGVFNLNHPLLRERKPQDWHIWTDSHPKVVREARTMFDEMRDRGETYNLTYDVTLPYDVVKLNQWLQLITTNIQHVVLFGYGMVYALSMRENYEWLNRLELPSHVDALFVFNSPQRHLPFKTGLMAAFHQQRMMYYDEKRIRALFDATLPGSEIVWSMPREKTRNKLWGTWLIESTAWSRRQAENG